MAEQSELIADIQTDEWWADVTYPMLEDARKRLRNLVQLIVHTNKNVLYSNFADEFGGVRKVDPAARHRRSRRRWRCRRATMQARRWEW